MKFKLLIFNLALFSGLGSQGLLAQEALPATGSTASGSGGSVSYSVGLPVYSFHTGAGGSVAEGVQQPFEIFVITGIDEARNIALSCSVYPNPTSDFLMLKVDQLELTDLHLQLFDLKGTLLQEKSITGRETSVTMQHLSSSIYFLKVLRHQETIKTFKIINN
jgi:hypothetical protein